MPRQINVQDLAARLASGERVYLVDVRQPWEHDTAALPRTDLLLPLDQLIDRHDEVTPPAGALVVTYCHHGIRSLNAAALLERAGLADVASLAGGIDRWSIEIDPTIPRY
jgi:adenylyltransferase/sulfurtransferase